MRHLHSLGIVHRDLKPENICFTTAELQWVKLIDLGAAVRTPHSLPPRYLGYTHCTPYTQCTHYAHYTHCTHYTHYTHLTDYSHYGRASSSAMG